VGDVADREHPSQTRLQDVGQRGQFGLRPGRLHLDVADDIGEDAQYSSFSARFRCPKAVEAVAV
jgi:hypothetical protein